MCMYVYIHICTYIHLYIYIYTHTYIERYYNISPNMCVYIYMCMYIYIYIYIKREREIAYTSRYVRVVLSQGPCESSLHRSMFYR